MQFPDVIEACKEVACGVWDLHWYYRIIVDNYI